MLGSTLDRSRLYSSLEDQRNLSIPVQLSLSASLAPLSSIRLFLCRSRSPSPALPVHHTWHQRTHTFSFSFHLLSSCRKQPGTESSPSHFPRFAVPATRQTRLYLLHSVTDGRTGRRGKLRIRLRRAAKDTKQRSWRSRLARELDE